MPNEDRRKISHSEGGMKMTDNIVSFEDRRLAKLDGTLFGTSDEELIIASTIARLEARHKERDRVRDYIERLDSGEVMLHPQDGSEPSPFPLIQLVDLLSDYDEMLTSEIGRLEHEKEMLDGPYQS
jgi:hypothetical protein